MCPHVWDVAPCVGVGARLNCHRTPSEGQAHAHVRPFSLLAAAPRPTACTHTHIQTKNYSPLWYSPTECVCLASNESCKWHHTARLYGEYTNSSFATPPLSSAHTAPPFLLHVSLHKKFPMHCSLAQFVQIVCVCEHDGASREKKYAWCSLL